jgi:hypothetical protein
MQLAQEHAQTTMYANRRRRKFMILQNERSRPSRACRRRDYRVGESAGIMAPSLLRRRVRLLWVMNKADHLSMQNENSSASRGDRPEQNNETENGQVPTPCLLSIPGRLEFGLNHQRHLFIFSYFRGRFRRM